jgi:hypothetical protein
VVGIAGNSVLSPLSCSSDKYRKALVGLLMVPSIGVTEISWITPRIDAAWASIQHCFLLDSERKG